MDKKFLLKGIFRRALNGIVSVGLLLSVLGTYPLVNVRASAAAQNGIEPVVISSITGNVLSNGEFVYGPNVGNFDIQAYLAANAPHLAMYAEDLYGRADYYSINPKVYLTLLEVHARLLSNPDPSRIEDPFNLASSGFIPQIDEISNVMVSAYYLHLYSYTGQQGVLLDLPPVTTADGAPLVVSPETNAGTYAIMAALALIGNEQDIPLILDNSQPDGFFQTYQRLFPGSDPTSEANHVYYTGEAGSESLPIDLLQLQLPYLKGESWVFNGVHDAAGADVGDPLVNAAAIDFSPNWPPWDVDTSNMWVVAAASGVPTKISSCSVRIAHGDGWETGYYHLDKIPTFSGWVDQNDKIGVIADNLAQAICTGGFSTGPHVHFTLRRNGAYVAINGTPLSGWYIHGGRWNYDDDPNYMWMERFGVRKVAGDPLLSESAALIMQISAGANHTCALTHAGAPRCWGNNVSGQLGDGTNINRTSPVVIPALTVGVSSIATGWNHTCALTTSGAVKCWGDNSSGQLGDGTTFNRTSPVNVTGFSSSGAIAISGGQLHTCLLTSAGGVKCWGDNSLGQLGDGTGTDSPSPVDVTGLSSGIKKITTGSSHTCALTSGGGVKCWGDNTSGQLGDGTTTSQTSPVDVTGLSSGVKAVSAGFDHTCAVTTGGAVKCWGSNTSGQLGDGTVISQLTPVAVSGLTSGMLSVASGNGFSCALNSTGAVKCWGSNASGQLGAGNTIPQLTPVDVVGLLNGVVIISTGGGEHTCSLTYSGLAQCWGGNAFGQLGDGTTTNQSSPVNVVGLTYVLDVIKTGTGSGTVNGSPAGISCGSYCSATYISGTSITLTATAATGSTFSGWSGEGCSGTGTCLVNMTAARSVTANFTINTYTLSASKTGSGSITSSPAGINCGTDCSDVYNYGTRVTLTATPDPGWSFSAWGGRCLGVVTNTCTVTVDAAKSVSVSFTNITYPLSLTKTGTGSGTVTSSPAGINCGATCSYSFGYNSRVVLTAAAATGSSFTGWSGGVCTGTGTCTVTMSAARSVTATFTLNPFTLTASKTGSGTITSSPAGINCGTDCSEAYSYGTRVTLTATPDGGAAFTGWGGRCLGVTTNVCTVTVDDNKAVSASFTSVGFTLTLAKTGTGSGTVTSSPAGINCGIACSYAFASNTVVTLTAMAASGSTFTGWSGSGCSGTGTCIVTMSAAKSVSAAFEMSPGAFNKTSPTNASTGQPLSLTLTWAASSGASSYQYCYDTTNDNACTTWVDNGTATSKAISGLSASTTYFWHVRAVNTIGTTYSNASSTAFWSFTTASSGTLPGAFNKTSPAKWSTGQPLSLTLIWAASPGAVSYQYCYDKTNDNACTTWLDNGSATSVSLSSLSPGTAYYWHVRAVNTTGTTYSNASTTAFWKFTTGSTGSLPGAFNKSSPLNAATGQPLSLTLSWAASSGATSYQYCYDTSNDNACTSWLDNGTATSKAISGLSAGTTYYWHVRAVNTTGTTYSNASSTAFWSFSTSSSGSLPGAFNKTSPTKWSTGLLTTVTLTWGVSSGSTSYQYCYDKTNDNACTNWIGIGNATSTMLSDLTPNTIYYWHVRAVNAAGTTYSNGSPTTFWNFKIGL